MSGALWETQSVTRQSLGLVRALRTVQWHTLRALVLLLLGAAVFADEPKYPDDAETRAAIQKGVDFLLQTQLPNGAWGDAGEAIYTFTGTVWSNPETHRSWRAATTGLACLALLEVADTEAEFAAADRSVPYLLQNSAVKRPSDWDTMNCWPYIYCLQALVAVHEHPRYAASSQRADIARTIDLLLDRLEWSQALSGGWGYLEFDEPRTRRPQWSTSFTTAAAVVAMAEARQAGFDVDEGMLERAARAVRRCRLPNGAYTYAVDVIPRTGSLEYINQVKGSLGRIQVCNLALHLTHNEVPAERMEWGLAQLFREHRFLDIARNRPIPHETFYYNSGYFYYFGHYYAARIAELLPPEQQAKVWPRLRHEIIKTQQQDGSMWDYDMHAYGKPYGVSYGLMTLVRSLPEWNARPEHLRCVPPGGTSASGKAESQAGVGVAPGGVGVSPANP